MPERRRKTSSNRRRRQAAPLQQPPPPPPPPLPPSAAASPPRRQASPAALRPPSPESPPPSPPSPPPPPPPPPSPPPGEESPCRTVCRSLRWCVDRPTAARPGLAEWSDLTHAAVPLADHLTRRREPAEPRLDPLLRLPHQDPMDGDDPYTWLSIGQGIPTTIEVMNLAEYGPVITGPVRASPFQEPGLPDRPLPSDTFNADALSVDLFRPYVKVLAPMDLTQVLLNRRVFGSIAVATNLFAHGRGRGHPMLAGWQNTDWKEIFRFFLTNHFIMAIRKGKATVSEEQLFRNPLIGRLFAPRRFHQLTFAWRLKTDSQTPDQFLEYAPRTVCARFERLLVRAAPVLSLHTYQMPLWCGRQREIVDAECRITVLKAGRYHLRVVFHLRARDSHQSGNSPTISVPLLEKLLKDIDLEGKYFTAVGGATLEMAKFFHLRNAHFVGSVGPQAYRILNPQKSSIPTPKLPSAGLYLEPYPDIREVILLREVTRLPARVTWIGFPVSKSHGLQQMHLLCNIGGGDHRSIFVHGPKKTTLEVQVPDSLWAMQPMGQANNVGVHQLCFENLSGANRGCMLWHQRITMHLLNMGFMNGWHAHAIATGSPLYRSDAASDIYHHLFGFMYDWVIRTHNLRCEPPLILDDDAVEEWDVPLSRGKLKFRITRGGPLEVGVEREPNAPPGDISHIIAALATVHGNGKARADDMRMLTCRDPSGAIFAADSATAGTNTRRVSVTTTRSVAWTQMVWRSISMMERVERPKPGEPHKDWHGFEVRDSPRNGSNTVTIQQTVLNDLKSYPLLSPEARAMGKRPATPTLSAVEVFYWGGLKMMPCTPNDDRPWRNSRPRRTSV